MWFVTIKTLVRLRKDCEFNSISYIYILYTQSHLEMAT